MRKEFKFLEVIGKNELMNAFIRFVYNLIWGVKYFENHDFRANEALKGIINFISLEQTPC